MRFEQELQAEVRSLAKALNVRIGLVDQYLRHLVWHHAMALPDAVKETFHHFKQEQFNGNTHLQNRTKS